jgi:hypothetical protein
MIGSGGSVMIGNVWDGSEMIGNVGMRKRP